MGILKRGENKSVWCPTYLSSGWVSRCWFCGGIESDCDRHCCYFDCCICKAHAESWRDVKIEHVINLLSSLFWEFVLGIFHHDWWWLKNGWKGNY